MLEIYYKTLYVGYVNNTNKTEEKSRETMKNQKRTNNLLNKM